MRPHPVLRTYLATMRSDLERLASDIGAIPDPIERAELAQLLVHHCRGAEVLAVQCRTQALREDRERGTCTIDEVAYRTGIPRNVVAEARRKSPRPTTRRGRQA